MMRTHVSIALSTSNSKLCVDYIPAKLEKALSKLCPATTVPYLQLIFPDFLLHLHTDRSTRIERVGFWCDLL